MDDHELAADLATRAGALLLDVRAEYADADVAERKAAGDGRSHEFLLDALTSARPSDAVLSEEGADDPVRLSSERVWIIDPLDGTREFSELDRDDWAVHVALWQGGDLVAGAVALPPRTSPCPRSGRHGVRRRRLPRVVVSRTRPPPSPFRSATSSTGHSSPWARLGRRSLPWSRARPTCMSMPAGSTVGFGGACRGRPRGGPALFASGRLRFAV